jgi:4-oxalocrotonate tautomerase
MPHVIVKLWPGKSEEQKNRLADRITGDVMAVLNDGEDSVSVSIEEAQPQDWTEKVYKPDILDNLERLYKKPGYKPQAEVPFPGGQRPEENDRGDS